MIRDFNLYRQISDATIGIVVLSYHLRLLNDFLNIKTYDVEDNLVTAIGATPTGAILPSFIDIKLTSICGLLESIAKVSHGIGADKLGESLVSKLKGKGVEI